MEKSWKLNLYALIIIIGLIGLSLIINKPVTKSNEVLSLNVQQKNLGEIVSIIKNEENFYL